MLQLDVLFGNLGEMVEFQVEFLRTLEDGIRLVPHLDRLERVEQFKVREGGSPDASFVTHFLLELRFRTDS